MIFRPKAIFSAIGALVVGAIIENKLAVVDKAVKAGKDLIDKVKNQIKKDCVKSNELCEMFVDFMTSAGYSEQNIWDYFKCE